MYVCIVFNFRYSASLRAQMVKDYIRKFEAKKGSKDLAAARKVLQSLKS